MINPFKADEPLQKVWKASIFKFGVDSTTIIHWQGLPAPI